MSKENKLMKNTVILTVGNMFPKLSTFLLLPILTKSLTKNEYGMYDLILTASTFALPIVTMLIEQAVFRFLLDAKNKEEFSSIISNSVLFVVITSATLSLISYITVKNIGIEEPELIILYILLDLYYKVILQIARGLKQLKVYSKSSIVNSIISIVAILFLVSNWELGLKGILIGLSISLVVSILYLLFKIQLCSYINVKGISVKRIKTMLAYSIPLIPNSLSWWIVAASDRWIVTSFLGLEQNAIYAVANKIPSMLNLLYANFNLAWQESASLSSTDADVSIFYSKTFKVLYDFLIGAILVLISLSPYIFSIFINDSYFHAYNLMPILFIAVFFHSLSSFYGGIYVAMKKSKELSSSSLLAALINIVINLLFITIIGIHAAAISTLIAYFVLTFKRANDIKKHIKISYDIRSIIIKISIVFAISAMCLLNNNIINILNLIAGLSISVYINKTTITMLISRIKSSKIKA